VIIIGLTGNIGSGKSLAASFLKEAGAFVIDADLIARDITMPGKPALAEIKNRFGAEYVDENGMLDRALLGKRVFSDAADLQALNAITHPRISHEITKILTESENKDRKCAVLEAALIFEKGFAELCREIWLITASRENILSRLRIRNGFNTDEAVARLDKQMPPQEQARRADIVICNNGSPEELRQRVQSLYKKIQSE
jgi:dephospho-CoA kinase